MEKGTDVQNSETMNGLNATVSRGLKALYRLLGGKNNEQNLTIEFHDEEVPGWFIMDGSTFFAGPYKTKGAATGQLTRYLKGYTPASRRLI
jgi:hypothetical protein